MISGDNSVIKAIQTNWQHDSVDFQSVSFDTPGALFITAANASFRSNTPVNITVQMPPKVIQPFTLC